MSVEIIWQANNHLKIQFEAKSQKDVFEKLASFSEILAETVCGACKKANLRYQVREIDNNKYYEIRCLDCRAVLAYGQHKVGETLFPKRKDAEGNYLPNGGWKVWEGK